MAKEWQPDDRQHRMQKDWGDLVIQQESKLSTKVRGCQFGLDALKLHSQLPVQEEEGKDKKEDVSLLHKLIHTQLVTCTADIEDLRKDPNHPLHSIKSFDALALRPELLKGVYNMGFNAPSKIQETALPALLAEPPINMIAQSQSGTGKTAAFVLTMLSRVDVTQAYPQCLCLAPTYELALQIGQVVEKMAAFINDLTITFAVRGHKVGKQAIEDHVVIGTPGTVLNWIQRKNLRWMNKIRVFVLDEADVMISIQGHKDQSTRIQRHLSKDCQMLLFSATYEDSVMEFACHIIPNPVTIRLRREEESLDNIQQYYIRCHSLQDKYRAICNIYGGISVGQTMIFCRKRETANWLVQQMSDDQHAVALLSGELTIEQRASIINRFRQGKEKVLITTNVSARGIDVVTVTVVVNFDLPVTMARTADCETYLHRIGRAGRFGKKGIAINMVESEQAMEQLRTIESHFGRKIEKLDTDDLDAVEKLDH